MVLNHGYAYRERISRAGLSLLEHLARRHPHSTEQAWRTRIETGEVEVNGEAAAPGSLLSPGQEVIWHRPPWEEPEVDRNVQWVHVDEALVAVVKPRGLPTLPGGGFLDHTLLALVRERFPEASPMHRLGRETSGLVLFARTASAGAALQESWRDHLVEKRYRALGSGLACEDAIDICAPIGPVPHPWLGTIHAACPQGKPSLSHARVLERRAGSTLFQVDIETGRPHQIRIHLAFAGHPLVGDPLYGAGGVPRAEITALPGDGGYFLHAERLAFAHPLDGHPVILTAAPPAELRMEGEASG